MMTIKDRAAMLAMLARFTELKQELEETKHKLMDAKHDLNTMRDLIRDIL